MITLVGFVLATLFGMVFVLLAITPMIAEHGIDREGSRTGIVSLKSPIVHRRVMIDHADAV